MTDTLTIAALVVAVLAVAVAIIIERSLVIRQRNGVISALATAQDEQRALIAKLRASHETAWDERDQAAKRARSYAVILGDTRRDLVAANLVLDTAYVRGPKGRMQRYRAETAA